MSRVCVDSVCESVECHTLFPKPLVHCWVPDWLQIPALHCVYTHKTPRDGVTSSIIFSNTSGLQWGVSFCTNGIVGVIGGWIVTRKVRQARLHYVLMHHLAHLISREMAFIFFLILVFLVVKSSWIHSELHIVPLCNNYGMNDKTKPLVL